MKYNFLCNILSYIVGQNMLVYKCYIVDNILEYVSI